MGARYLPGTVLGTGIQCELQPNPRPHGAYHLLMRWMLKKHKYTITGCGKCHEGKGQETMKDDNLEVQFKSGTREALPKNM